MEVLHITVGVCTRNRAKQLAICLNSIKVAINQVKLDFPNINFILLVANNNSTDNTAIVIDQWIAENKDVNCKHLETSSVGLSVARNRILKDFFGDYIIFTDDDCTMDEDYFVDLLGVISQELSPLVVSGSVLLGDETDLPITINTNDKYEEWYFKSDREEFISRNFHGCNFVLSKKTVEKVGYFDERLGAGRTIPAGEDTDYFYRAYLGKIKLIYTPNMIVYHFHSRKTELQGRSIIKCYNIATGAIAMKYILRYSNFSKVIYWNLKLALRERIDGKNNLFYMPELGINYYDVLKFNLLGVILYLKELIKRSKKYSSKNE